MNLAGKLRQACSTNAADPEPFALHACAALLILVAFGRALAAVWDLTWPCDVDLYRDIGFARSMLDGRPLDDPAYLGEKIWYNPLVPALIALSSVVTPLPLERAAVLLGPVANLISPVGFYVMALALVGRRAALVSLAAYLFIDPGTLPSWASATYSPWLFTSNFVQGLFYLGVAAYLRARRQERAGWRGPLLVGALLGLTFLGHTAPALILGAIIALDTLLSLWAWRREEPGHGPRHAAVVRLLIIMATAALVSVPYTWSIVGHYGLAVVNREPSSWLWGDIAVFQIWPFITRNTSALIILPCLGLGAVLACRDRPGTARLMLIWLGISGMLFAHNYLWQLLKLVGIQVPAVVPGHHFLIYLKAAEVMLVGAGLRLLTTYLVELARHLAPALDRSLTAREGRAHRAAGITLAVATVALVAAYVPRYLEREDFRVEVDKARRLAPNPGQMQAYRWLLSSAKPTDVVLTNDHYTLHLVNPSGRKIVSTVPYFSNPFTDWQPRDRARHGMFAALGTGDAESFLRLAARYKVSLVLVDPSQPIDAALTTRGAGAPVLKQVFSDGGVTIYRVKESG